MATAFASFSANKFIDDCVRQGRNGFHSIRVLLTPDIAKELMDRNPANRSIARSRVDIYASDMKAGRWAFNGEPIIVSSDGCMTDGQHRCAAVIQSGTAIETAISFGVDYESRKTTNQARAKTAGDFAGMDGIPNSMGQAAIAKMAIAYDALRSVSRRGTTQAEILEYIHANQPSLARSAALCHSRSSKMRNIVSPSVAGFAHYVMAKKDRQMADTFIEQVITGQGLNDGDPALAVRNRFITMSKATRSEKAEMLLHGWNAYRRGLKRVMAKTTGSLPDIV